MGNQAKKKINLKEIPLSSPTVGRVITSQARFAHPDMDLNFAYYHAMDIWQRMDLDLRRKLKKETKTSSEI